MCFCGSVQFCEYASWWHILAFKYLPLLYIDLIQMPDVYDK
jgi:hypothetical protein